jgi:lysophospholipase L1-like esterase
MNIRTIAALGAASFALAACGGGGGAKPIPPGTPQNNNNVTTTGSVVAAAVKIVGVGDSLTAGTQSGGTVGQLVTNAGYADATYGAYAPVPETQEHGFFADLWESANGVTISALENTATSPLPLFASPGIGSLLGATQAGFPSSTTATLACQGNQAAAYSVSGALADRINPGTIPYDVAVPGMTTHEVIAQTGPIGTCVTPAQEGALAGTAAGREQLALNALLQSESVDFYPVLANFGTGVTQLQAAVSLHGQYATVNIGSNDLLHFAFANGGSPPAAASSIGADITTITTQLQASGAKVAVANLVDVLGAATFYPIGTLNGTHTAYTLGSSQTPTYEEKLTQFVDDAIVQQAEIANPGVPLALIEQSPTFQAQIAGANQEALGFAESQIATAQLGQNGYFLLPVLLETTAAILTGATTPPAVDAPGTGNNGAGEYVSDSVALTVKSLNAAYDTAIAASVSSTGAALVDVAGTFTAAENAQAAGTPTIVDANGDAVNLQYGGGFFSYDGLHPSDTGYAVIANLFIAAFDSKYGTTWPAVNTAAIYAADPYSPTNYAVIHAAKRAQK